jgi:hypothetical protein
MRGDILFYFATRNIFDQIIARFTNGPFCHVSVDLGDGTDVSAMHDGVKVRPLPDPAAFRRLSLPQGSRVEEGVKYMLSELGNGYGFIDIVNQVLRVLHSPIFLSARDQYDCSDLVARYVLVTGGLDLGEMGEEPHMVTPNDLARVAGLI